MLLWNIRFFFHSILIDSSPPVEIEFWIPFPQEGLRQKDTGCAAGLMA